MPYATDYTTLLTGSYWSGAEVTGQPVFVTYSFDATAPASDANNLAPSAYATFTPFTAAQQAQAKQALTDWSSASTLAGGGSAIIFLQVAPGKGDINFAAYNFSSDPNAKSFGGEGFYPWGNWNYSTGQPGVIHFGADLAGAGNILMNTDPAFENGGLFSYQTVLHEIGHALGLKHPTDAWTNYVDGQAVVHNQYDPNSYIGTFSIMSPFATSLTEPTTNDWQAIQSIYGTPAQAAQQDKSWSWNATTDTLKQVLKGGAQTVRGVSTNNIIVAGSGADTIYAIGAGTNTVYGGAGSDVLVGGGGISYLIAGSGPDAMNGWFGISYADYANAPAGVTVDLLNPALNTGQAAGDTYLHISRVVGSKYADTLIADNNGDVLVGGLGADTLVGGTGADTFVYKTIGDSTPAGTDLIENFHTGDKIDVSAIDANTGLPGHQAFHIGATQGHAGDIIITYDSVNNRTVVDLYDNSTGVPDGRIWLSGDQALTAADFVLKATKPPASPPASPAALASAMAALGAHPAGLIPAALELWRAETPMMTAPRTHFA